MEWWLVAVRGYGSTQDTAKAIGNLNRLGRRRLKLSGLCLHDREGLVEGDDVLACLVSVCISCSHPALPFLSTCPEYKQKGPG